MASHDSRTFELETPLGKDVLLLKSMHGIEAMSQPFQWKLALLSEEKNDVDPDAVLGQKVVCRHDPAEWQEALLSRRRQ